jgi:ABC-2 family transporter protein
MWTAWRLQRSVYFFFVAVGVVLIAYTVTNGLHLEALEHQWQGPPCHGGNGFVSRYQSLCQTQNTHLIEARNSGFYVHLVALVPSTILAILLGANAVAGELGDKTVRLAWTQSITRGRWFLSKIGVGLISVASLAVPLSLTVSWWRSTTQWTSRMSTNGFTYSGWMPLAVGAFAFSLAVIVGIVLRRPGWSMAVSLATVITLMWFMQTDVRSNLVPLRSTTISLTTQTKGGVTMSRPTHGAPEDSWVVFSGFLPTGARNFLPTWAQETPWLEEVNRCPSTVVNGSTFTRCLRTLGLRNVELYVADDEYWTLQLREGGVYLTGAALLLGASLLLVRRTKT